VTEVTNKKKRDVTLFLRCRMVSRQRALLLAAVCLLLLSGLGCDAAKRCVCFRPPLHARVLGGFFLSLTRGCGGSKKGKGKKSKKEP